MVFVLSSVFYYSAFCFDVLFWTSYFVMHSVFFVISGPPLIHEYFYELVNHVSHVLLFFCKNYLIICEEFFIQVNIRYQYLHGAVFSYLMFQKAAEKNFKESWIFCGSFNWGFVKRDWSVFSSFFYPVRLAFGIYFSKKNVISWAIALWTQ